MNPRSSYNELAPLVALCAAFLLFLAAGKGRAAEPVIEGFVSPEQIVKNHDQIGLTDDQLSTLKTAFEDAQERVHGFQQQMQQETMKLTELAKASRVDEKSVIAQADKILDVEREVKHAQLSLLVLIKNTLTADQQAKLKELSSSNSGGDAGKAALQAKLSQVKEAAQRWQQEGRDLTPLADVKTEIESLMAQGKAPELSAALDRALKILNGKETK